MNHILIVDDDPAIRVMIVDMLEMSDYRVKTASNGAEALDQVRAEQPAAILLDLMMPVMDGWQFLRRCRRESPCALIPVAVMSAARDAASTLTALGAQAFVSKPFDLDEVVGVVSRLATGARRAEGGGPI